MIGAPEHGAPASGARGRAGVIIGGAVFFTSGAALIVHILTGAPLPLMLAAVATAAGLAMALGGLPRSDFRVAWLARVRAGVIAGLVATGVYDLARWLLVEVAGLRTSPFTALPLFGIALVGAGSAAVQLWAGIGFHLLNGTMFGIAYAVWFGDRRFWWGIAFAFGLEAAMLAVYPGWLDIRSVAEFTQITVFGHFAYGSTLGMLTPALLRRWSR